MNQIERIIHSALGKALVLCAFALGILVAASVAVASRGSGSVEHRNRQSIVNNDLGPRGHGFVRNNNGDFTTIDAPDATYFTLAFGIGGNGQIVGYYTPAQPDEQRILRGFLLDNGVFTDINFPDGNPRTLPFDINDQGQIAGSYNLLNRGYLRDESGAFTAIDAPNVVTETAAAAINNLGQIVGSFNVGRPGKFSGFVRDKQGIFTRVDFPEAMGTGITSMIAAGSSASIFE
jgi:uncharacterized membrane protein